jgi:hypothetical protein
MRVLRSLASRSLACGCQVGIYETYAGPIVSILDERGSDCPDRYHRTGLIVPTPRDHSPTDDARPAGHLTYTVY